MLFVYNLLIQSIAFVTSLFNRSHIDSDPFWKGRYAQIDVVENVDIWIHAASVGEVKVVGHLIKNLQSQKSDIKIHITSMTRTGYETALDMYRHANISITQFPFDTKVLMEQTFQKINPKLLLITETEIWPNFILEADKKDIPIILINGRMSEMAFNKYKLFTNSFKMLLQKYEKLFLKSDDDFSRYNYFLPKEKLQVCGDMKFDAPLETRSQEIIDGIKIACGIDPKSFVCVAGSTRPGEEELLADMFLKIIDTHKTFNLIIAPRHIERLSEIQHILQKKNIQFKLYGSDSKHDSVILVDKLGLLQKLYIAADIAFVGGTLVDIGGHNLLEPVWAGAPVVFGTSTYNVTESAEYIQKNNFGTQVADIEELTGTIEKFLTGEIKFNQKNSNNLANSATQKIGKYILEKL